MSSAILVRLAVKLSLGVEVSPGGLAGTSSGMVSTSVTVAASSPSDPSLSSSSGTSVNLARFFSCSFAVAMALSASD
jgi:hypothetical protein